MQVGDIMRAAALALALSTSTCGREPADEAGPAPRAPAVGDLAQPPSAAAPRASPPGFAPDTLRPDTPARGDTAFGAPDRPRATSELSVDSIVGRYRNHYPAQLLEFGSDVQGDVDPQVVDAAKRRTALDFGYVELDAWSDLVAELTEAQRLELAERIEQSNREFARQLHRGDASQPR